MKKQTQYDDFQFSSSSEDSHRNEAERESHKERLGTNDFRFIPKKKKYDPSPLPLFLSPLDTPQQEENEENQFPFETFLNNIEGRKKVSQQRKKTSNKETSPNQRKEYNRPKPKRSLKKHNMKQSMSSGNRLLEQLCEVSFPSNKKMITDEDEDDFLDPVLEEEEEEEEEGENETQKKVPEISVTRQKNKFLNFEGSSSAEKIDHQTIELLENIGSGGFGTVFGGIWRIKKNNNNEKVDVAIKEIVISRTITKTEIIKEFTNQSELLSSSTSSQYIVKVYGYCEPRKNVFWIVMERMESNLLEFLQNICKKPPLITEKLEIMRKMNECVRFLHSQNILHRDIKCSNFLQSNNGFIIKICDFGFVKMKRASQKFVNSERRGTVEYMAPEVLLRSGSSSMSSTSSMYKNVLGVKKYDESALYSEKSDVYALGISFWEVLYEKSPFQGVDPQIVGFRLQRFWEKMSKSRFKSLEYDDQDHNQRKLGMPVFMEFAGDGTDKCGSIPYPLKRYIKKMWMMRVKERPDTLQIQKWFLENEEEIRKRYSGKRFIPPID